ncbi:hypothetical protein SAMN05192533_101368 [Mesobacillus persicus]|uniref:Asp23 family, cell envelope-related function n=1 Tax=Mesobacillus persicus TaxID=930146 RepID=A0A1H7WD33_9BACI|nr:hypothetical protein [Mesobacillus persicus]SEM19421.1 hypothetical protein SAMN05192533_101368 [Mesobacillus persicus]
MKVFALVGKSGTGKSTSILQYCYENRIPAFIDDGLLIVNGKRSAGTSAKYENNYIRAIKRATFHFDDHRLEVINEIQRLPIKHLLIVGTSIKMVDQIASRLDLGNVDKYIDVTEVRSSQEIKMALFVRKTQERHVIPIPYIQIEANRFKKLMKKGKKIFSKHQTYIGENTIIQPNFTKGTISIDENVMKDIISYTCREIARVGKAKNIRYYFDPSPRLSLQVDFICSMNQNIVNLIEEVQAKIAETILSILEIELVSIDVTITNLKFEKIESFT